MADTGPKSAVELAMERLRRQDAEAEILMQSKLAATFDLEGRREIEANHRRDLGQFASARDRKIAAIRKGDGP